MPARTNLRQRVVFHIQRQLTGNGRVEESVLLTDQSSRSQREVDVVIRARVGEHDVVVGVECRDHQRKATVEWVEQMAMKHSSLPTSKLVLVSTSGFSRTAIAKATSLNIDIYSFDEAVSTDWTALLGDGVEPDIDVWALRILGCGVVLVDDEVEYTPPPKVAIFNDDSTFRSSLGDIVRSEIQQSSSFTEKAVLYAQDLREPVFGAEVKMGSPLFVEDNRGHRHEIEVVRVYLEVRQPSSPLSLSTARYRGSPVAYGRSQSPAGEFEVTLVQAPSGPPAGAMSVTDPRTGETQTVDVRCPAAGGTLAFLTDPVRRKSRGEG